MLGGIKDYEGVRTLRCGALCVDPEHRKLGVATKLYEFHKRLAAENGCKRLYLEVIQGNDKAISFYKKHGYKIFCELEYYSHANPGSLTSSIPGGLDIQKADLEELESIHKNSVQTHLNWQNDFDFMKFFSQAASYKLTVNGEVLGVVSVLPSGKIFYLWVKPEHRRQGYGKALLSYTACEFKMQKIMINFPKDENIIGFLINLGFAKDTISQYEMAVEL